MIDLCSITYYEDCRILYIVCGPYTRSEWLLEDWGIILDD